MHLLAAVMAVVVSPVSHAQTTEVRVDGDNGSAEPPDLGRGWGTDAYMFLQDALDRARDLAPDFEVVEVWVAGTNEANSYHPDRDHDDQEGSGDRTASFDLANKIQLLGGFAGNEESALERDTIGNETVLSGDLDQDDGPDPFANNDENSYHVVEGINVGSSARIDGFTIVRGNADQGLVGENRDGGGMRLNQASPIVLRCVFRENFAFADGGGAFYHTLTGQVQEFWNCQFLSNSAADRGGGVFQNTEQTPSVCQFVNCLFADNIPEDDSVGAGYFADKRCDTTFINCTFASNEAGFAGAGLCIADYANETLMSTLDIRNCILWGNVVGGNSSERAQISDNAGLWIEDSNLALAYTTIQSLDVYGGEEYGGDDVIEADPLFVDPAAGDFRLGCCSGCIEGGDQSIVPDDLFDLDQDGETNDTVPDLDLMDRIVGTEVDMGCYEYPCNLASDINGDGSVDFADLLALLAAWGPCRDCPEDLNGDDMVDFDDLLLVLANWCSPTSIQDVVECMGLAWPYDWNTFLSCVDTGTTVAQENCACWMEHYYYCHCLRTCLGPPNCSGADPWGNH
jgi:hypothetical protein